MKKMSTEKLYKLFIYAYHSAIIVPALGLLHQGKS